MNEIRIEPGSDLNPYFTAHRTKTRFILRDGTYWCYSGWSYDRAFDHCVLGADCELIGAGIGRTFITAMSGPVPDEAWQIECFTAGSRSEYCANVTLRGFTLICPPSRTQPRLLGVIGIHVWSDRCVIEGVRVEGCLGVRPVSAVEPSRESFGIVANQSGKPRRVGGSRIRDVEVSVGGHREGMENYVTGLYPGWASVADHSVVENALVENLQPGLASVAFGVNSGVLMRNVRNTGRWGRALYCDCVGGSRSRVSDSVLRAELILFELRGSTAIRWAHITVSGSHLEITPVPEKTNRAYAAALVLAPDGQPPGPLFDHVSITNSEIVAGEGTHHLGSMDAHGLGCGVFCCRIVGAWGPFITTGKGIIREFGNLRVA